MVWIKKKMLWVIAFVLGCLLLDFSFWFYESNLQGYNIMDVLSETMIGKTIVVDAGHGGFDPGAIGLNGTEEKDVNLAVSRRLSDYLRQSGANVMETRTGDKALADTKKLDMEERVKIAGECGAEFFVSVQANFLPQHQYRGAQTFFGKDDMQGKELAETIQKYLTEVLKNTDRVAMGMEEIYVMRELSIPVAVVEVGFLSNEEEERLLNDEEYQNEVAYAIYLGIVQYCKEKDDRKENHVAQDTICLETEK